MYYFQKSYYFPIQKTFNNGTSIELWVTLSPFAQKPCGALQQSWGTSETLGSRYCPMYSPLSPRSRLFHRCLVLITPLCAPRFGFSHHLPPSPQGLEEGSCGTAGAGQPSHPILVGTDAEHFSCFDRALRGCRRDLTDRYSQSHSPPSLHHCRQAKCLRSMHSCSILK